MVLWISALPKGVCHDQPTAGALGAAIQAVSGAALLKRPPVMASVPSAFSGNSATMPRSSRAAPGWLEIRTLSGLAAMIPGMMQLSASIMEFRANANIWSSSSELGRERLNF